MAFVRRFQDWTTTTQKRWIKCGICWTVATMYDKVVKAKGPAEKGDAKIGRMIPVQEVCSVVLDQARTLKQQATDGAVMAYQI